jgi:hypothetical protein
MRARYEEALAEVEEMKRSLRDRAQFIAELEQRLMRQAEHGGGSGRRGRRPAAAPAVGGPDESDLARAVAAAEAEKALAEAEREKLDERERTIRKVERELAQLRVQLQQERARLSGDPGYPAPAEPEPEGEPPAPTPLPQPPDEPDLEPAARTARRRR